MNGVSIAVIIPNFNKSLYLEECIASIEKQTEIPDEIIFVDDCSSDNSLEIVSSLQKKYKNLTIIKNKENKGVSYSRNIGVKKSNSEYICFLDSDDFFINTHFFEHIKKHVKKSRMTYMLYAISDINGNIDLRYKNNPDFTTKRFSKTKMKIMCCMNCSNSLIPRCYVVNKECFLKSGLFDETLSLYEDSDVICNLMKYVTPFIVGEYGPVYRTTNNGLSRVDISLHRSVRNRLKKKHFDWKCKLLCFIYKLKPMIKGNHA